MQEFLTQLRAFAQATRFMEFHDSHKETFQAAVADARKKIQGAEWIGVLESYYGMKQNSYNVILAPLFHPGGFGCRVRRQDGTYDIYNICGPRGVENGIPVFGTPEGFQYLAWHEFSHSFVNPTTEKFAAQIATYSSLYTPIADVMKKQAYPRWDVCVNEHIVRAVTIRLACREVGEEAGEQATNRERAAGFRYVGALCDRLRDEYEKDRNEYPTLPDFYPRLLDVFKEISAKGADSVLDSFFPGTINAAVTDKKSVVLIVPTRETDKTVQDRIHAYAKQMRDRFFPWRPVVKDSDALKQDLSAKTLIAYGTATGNLWLARQMARLPFRIEANQIVADAVYPGTGLRFLSVWPNPSSPARAVVIYTAQRAEDVVGINNVFHGPTDFVVARGTEILKAGDYRKHAGTWIFAK